MKITEKHLDQILNQYPAKVRRNRKKHILIMDSEAPHQVIEANTRTVPGIITNRGCAFAGCKGVVLGPLKDVVHIVHGPVGCGYYAWLTRRNKARSAEGKPNYLAYCVTTDMQESDIVFGGEKKLLQLIDEVMDVFNPPAITVSATCPVGLIGDDLEAVIKTAMERYPGVNITAYSCEGYRGVSQSAGHHIANNGLTRHVIGKGDMAQAERPFTINILGEYNIGGDGWEIKTMLEEIGYHVQATMTGDGSYEELVNAHISELNLVQCHRSINYIADMLEEKYGTPWLKVNFVGVRSTADSLRSLAQVFGDEGLINRTEMYIERELARIGPVIEGYRQLLDGKTSFCYVGGSRGHHYQGLYEEIGVTTTLAGYEFAHRDDYEGREVLPFIQLDADSRNIPELQMEADAVHYRRKITDEDRARLDSQGIKLGYYEGLNCNMVEGGLVVDDLNHYETEQFIEKLHPSIFSSGIKDKYVVNKMGIPVKQLHNYDYSGPYAGFSGAVNFARDVAMSIMSPTWQYIIPPWREKALIKGVVNEGGHEHAGLHQQ